VATSQVEAAIARTTANFPEDDPQRTALLATYADTRSALSKREQFSQQLNTYAQAGAIEQELSRERLSPQTADAPI
jgi:hypothetical protein